MASHRRRNLRPAIALGSVLLLGCLVGGYMLFRGPSKAEAQPDGTGVKNEPTASEAGPGATGEPERLAASEPVTPPATQPKMVTPPPAAAVSPGTELVSQKPATEQPSKPAPVVQPPTPRVVEDYPADLQGQIRAADQKIEARDLVTGRELLNRALHSEAATEADRESLRARIAKLNEDLVFSPTIYKEDPLAEVYTVQSGDSLTKIVPREGLAVETGFVARVNRMSNPNNLRVGQKLKLIRGPFHAVVTKSAFRMDIYAGNPGEESDWIYIRSFTVGLGEGDSTPVGTFVIRRNSKLINPPWINPRNHDKFAADDPKNPIGERWLGLEGTGASAAYSGYGIHGTIDPDSVGQMKSMGCVRLRTEDIEVVYDMLVEAISTVRIDP